MFPYFYSSRKALASGHSPSQKLKEGPCSLQYLKVYIKRFNYSLLCFVPHEVLKAEPGCLLSDGSISLQDHGYSRSITNILELLDVCSDIISFILLLGGHHQGEGGVNVRHCKCPCLLVYL